MARNPVSGLAWGTLAEEGFGMEILKTALRAVGRWLRSARDWASGDDLFEAQSHRSDGHELRSNPGGPGGG